MQIEDIEDEDSLRAWLIEQDSYKVSVTIAARAALRVQPWLWSRMVPVRLDADVTAIPFIWSTLTPVVATKSPTVELRAAAGYASDAAGATDASVESAACAAIAASAASESLDPHDFAASSAAMAAKACSDCTEARTAGARTAGESAGAATWKEVRVDCRRLSSGSSVWLGPLWTETWTMAQDWNASRLSWTSSGPPWDAFARIYDCFWQGKEPDWTYLEQVVLIDPEVWEAGPEAIAEAIAEIEAARPDTTPTPLSLATVTDFFCDSTLRQMRLAGFDDDLAHLREPYRVRRFVDDVQEARDGLQDFADYASDARGQTNAPAVLATAAEKMLAELERAQDCEHVRARRIIILGKQLRGLSGEETKRSEIGETLAGMLDDSLDLLADVCRKHFAPSIEVLNALDGLDLADTPPAALIARFAEVLNRIDHADGHTLVPLSPDAAALLHDMLEEMKDTEASLAEADSATFIARLRDRLASQAGALGATIGRYYEKGAPHADAAGKSADQAIKNYKRWKSLQDILAWLGDVFGGGAPPAS